MPEPATVLQVLHRARTFFSERFGHGPKYAAAAPGRVNLIGEHTDYNGGFVLPIAIDRVCVAAVGPSPAGVFRLASADAGPETVEVAPSTLDDPARFERGHWASYIAGVISGVRWEAGSSSGDGTAWARGLDIAVASDVPLGAGLSSSASLEVAVAAALERAWSVPLAPRVRARLCRRAEHEYAGVPCGIMDQAIASMGKRGHALLIDCQSEEGRLVSMPAADRVAVLVINTGVRHALASGEYGRRRAACQRAADRLGVALLREVDLATLERNRTKLDGEEYRCARHVVAENARTLDAAAALSRGDEESLAAVGRLMNESHESLRHDYRVSCAELDTVVEAARGVEGVFGARMTGGGFGGCAVALCRPGAVDAATEAVGVAYRAAHPAYEPMFFVTHASDGARPLTV